MVKTYFLDIDDCLIHTSALTNDHLKAFSGQLSKFGVEKSKEITREFAASFHRLYDIHQDKRLSTKDQRLHYDYISHLTRLEKPVVDRYGEIKRWSREVCLFIAGQKYSVNLSNEILMATANALWTKITQLANFYPDTQIFLSKLISRQIPFYLITSSDSRLTKDDKTGLFHYNPEYSRSLKMKRLQKFTDLGIPPEHIFIGDPIDKPKTWVFEEALKCARKELSESFESVMVSDSYSNDLAPARKIGITELILLVRHKQRIDTLTEVNQVVKSLNEIILYPAKATRWARIPRIISPAPHIFRSPEINGTIISPTPTPMNKWMKEL